MNANELADELESCRDYELPEFVHKTATMLRQQQAEIAELKHMNRNWQISENILLLELEKLQHREITDEEIGQIWKDCMESPYMQISNPVGFARAILRKAQEQ